MTGILITMVSSGVICAIGEDVCNAFGKADIAKYIKIGGVSLCACSAVGLVIKLITTVKSAFGG